NRRFMSTCRAKRARHGASLMAENCTKARGNLCSVPSRPCVISLRAMMKLAVLLVLFATSINLGTAVAQQVAPTQKMEEPVKATTSPLPPKQAPEVESKSAAADNTADQSPPKPSMLPIDGQFTATTSAPNGTVTLNIPNSIKLEGFPKGADSGSSATAWIALIGVIITACVTGWIGLSNVGSAEATRILTANQNTLDRNLRKSLADMDANLRTELAKLEQAESRRQADRAHRAGMQADYNKMSIEERRIKIELQRLGFETGASDNSTYLSVIRFVHEQQVKEGELLKAFSEQLLGKTEQERLFALLVLSAYVNLDVLKRLTDGGEQIISTESLKILAKSADEEISAFAQDIIEKRTPPASATTIADPLNK
ncbi:hypothetical protein MKL09_25125, partial [Methylobacterium sp. J-048]|uniref:hypothetical protein n=1 Tax=Methylobacterium sp. J-048 TaxID=2836635 RepID=UPI001FBB34C4